MQRRKARSGEGWFSVFWKREGVEGGEGVEGVDGLENQLLTGN